MDTGPWRAHELPPGGLVSLHEFPELDDEDSGMFATHHSPLQTPVHPPELFVPRAGTVIASPDASGDPGDRIDDDVLSFSPRVTSPALAPHVPRTPPPPVTHTVRAPSPPVQAGPEAHAAPAPEPAPAPQSSGDETETECTGDGSADGMGGEPVAGAGMGHEDSYVAELRRVAGDANGGKPLQQVYQSMCRMLARGEELLHAQRVGDAMRTLERALPLARRLGLRRIESRICSNLSNLHITRGDVARARVFNTQHMLAVRPLRRVSEGSAFPMPAGDAGNVDGDALVARHGVHAVEAEREYGKALGNRGNIALLAREYAAAVRIFRERLLVAMGCGDRDAAAMAFGNLGVAYQACRQYHQAVSMYARRRVHARAQGDVRTEVKMDGHMAACLCAMGQYKRALRLYATSIERMARTAGMGDARAQVTAHMGVGECYEHLDMARRALGFYSRAMALLDHADANSADTQRLLRRLYKRAARCHDALGEAEQAAHYQRLAVARLVDEAE